MAIEAYIPLNEVEGFRRRPIDEHGKLRFVYSKTVVAIVGDIGSTFSMGEFPPGVVRYLPYLSRVRTTAFAAARTLSIGHAAYRKAQDVVSGDGTEAASVNAFASALDLSAIAILTPLPTLLKYDLYSLAGVKIVGTLAGGTAPIAAELETILAYLYE